MLDADDADVGWRRSSSSEAAALAVAKTGDPAIPLSPPLPPAKGSDKKAPWALLCWGVGLTGWNCSRKRKSEGERERASVRVREWKSESILREIGGKSADNLQEICAKSARNLSGKDKERERERESQWPWMLVSFKACGMWTQNLSKRCSLTVQTFFPLIFSLFSF